MKKAGLILLAITVLVLVSWYVSSPDDQSQLSLSGLEGDVGRGAYLARASGCIACHTDFEEGGAPLAGGPPLKTPFGVFYAPNLTMDKRYGIGGWTVEQFATALRAGKNREGLPYYPAFPYTFYTQLSDQDVVDLWAAFQTVPAVAEPSKPHQLGFPFNLRQGLVLWQELFFNAERFLPEPGQSAQYNRGKYLVESVTHCAACHSERNLLGALNHDDPFNGSDSMLEGEGRIPAITGAALTKKGWTEKDLSFALQSGVMQDGDAFGGSMGEVVRYGTSFMQREDLDAIAHYLFNRR